MIVPFLKVQWPGWLAGISFIVPHLPRKRCRILEKKAGRGSMDCLVLTKMQNFLSSARKGMFARWPYFPLLSVPRRISLRSRFAPKRNTTLVGGVSFWWTVQDSNWVSADSLLRTDVPEVRSLYQSEFDELLADCSTKELDSILKIVRELKSTIARRDEDNIKAAS